MKKTDDIWATTVVLESGVDHGSAAAEAVERRADIMQMTQIAENAVLSPNDPGGWPLPLRAAFATRIARLNGADRLAEYYAGSIDLAEHTSIATPGTDDKISPSVKFLDAVASRPRDITAEDIKLLQDADITDADIVRLTELVAFVSYQIRLVAGLSLLAEAPT
ncbi:MAG: CMD domain-containing protein [Paracoccaceae bacterium]